MRQVVQNRILRCQFRPHLTAFIIVADKKILSVQHLDILQSVNGLDSPLGNSGLDVLVALADRIQFFLENLGVPQGQKSKNQHEEKRHLPVDPNQINHQKEGNYTLRHQLQQRQNEGKRMGNVSVRNPKHRGNIRPQVFLVRAV